MNGSPEKLSDFLAYENLNHISGEDLSYEIFQMMYKEEYDFLENRDFFVSLPTLVRDIVCFTLFDISRLKDGFWSFFENSTCLFFEDTKEAFVRAGLYEEKTILEKVDACVRQFHRENTKEDWKGASLYDLTNSIYEQDDFENLMIQVDAIGEPYFDEHEEQFYNQTYAYIEKEKETFLEELRQQNKEI